MLIRCLLIVIVRVKCVDLRSVDKFYSLHFGSSMSQSFPIKIVVILLFLTRLMLGETVTAQELGYGGVGSINHSMAGVAAALPLEGSGAIYWNPATIGDLEHGEFQLGFGRVNAPWYGDETLAYPVAAVGFVAWAGLALYSWLNNDDDDDDHYRSKSSGGSNNKNDDDKAPWEQDPDPVVIDTDQFYKMSYPTVRGLSFSWVMPQDPDIPFNVGLNVRQLGSRKIRFFDAPDDADIKYAGLYRIKTTEIAPAFSLRMGKRFQFGISPIMAFDEMPDGSLPTLRGYTRTTERSHLGVGLQLGVYYRTKNDFSFGFSVLSPYWTPGRSVQWIDGNSIIERKIDFSPDHPLRFVLGVAYTNENIKVGVDVRHYNFQHISSLNRLSGRDSIRNATSLAAGIEYAVDGYNNPLTLRLGYQYNSCSPGWDDVWNNITPPVSGGHSIHYGFSLGVPRSKGLEFSLSISHTLGGGYFDYTTDSGSARLRRNPNHNAFWWGLRYKY